VIEDMVLARIPQKGVRRRLSSKSPTGSPRMPLTAAATPPPDGSPPPVPPLPTLEASPPIPPMPATPPSAATTPPPRPASVVLLPETPLTHPEAFSCPDIRRALFHEDGHAPPVAPPRNKKKGGKEPQTEPIKGVKRERRKSIIQAVSDLFSRKKEPPPVPPPPANYPPEADDSASDGDADSKTLSVRIIIIISLYLYLLKVYNCEKSSILLKIN
jgi:hypothetical protein